ncbi:MAG: GAF domain-containing protein [Planctomycetota bacterium]|nr:GAF domain-containing protein [Planctomycetota bacterium]MDA1214005.1 GAF domain-containing protein [Planctomycetota bacterium]
MADLTSRQGDEPIADFEAVRAFADGLRQNSSIDDALDRLLLATDSRATGFWRTTGEFLVQVGFRAVPDMPTDVREEFRQITTQLPLSKTDLGIVKAAVTRQPVAAYRIDNSASLTGSATWLERFACRQSLAVPIYRGEELRGVIAISTPEEFDANSKTWKQMIALAHAIGEQLSI